MKRKSYILIYIFCIVVALAPVAEGMISFHVNTVETIGGIEEEEDVKHEKLEEFLSVRKVSQKPNEKNRNNHNYSHEVIFKKVSFDKLQYLVHKYPIYIILKSLRLYE